MNDLSNEQITQAIQYMGLNLVMQIRQELIEGLRNGFPDGYPALRKLLGKLAPPIQTMAVSQQAIDPPTVDAISNRS